MNLHTTTTLLILMTSTTFGAERRIVHYYQKNQKIWGTYSLVSKKTKQKHRKEKWNNEGLGDIVLKKKRIHFITPVRVRGRTMIKVEKIPYQKLNGKYHLQEVENMSFKTPPTDAYCQRLKGQFTCTFNFKD